MNEGLSGWKAGSVLVDEAGRHRRPVSILELLHWAFQRECAQIEFPDDARQEISATYAMMRVYQCGVRVDGGGRSLPHPDADLVAAALSVLPEGCGGRGMAVTIAELARQGSTPDWGDGAQPQCVPEEWRNSKHGRFAKTVSLGVHRILSRGRVRQVDVRICPVRHLNEASEVARRRRGYMQWWGALLELRQTFRIHDNLSAFVVTDDMPAMRPWEKRG